MTETTNALIAAVLFATIGLFAWYKAKQYEEPSQLRPRNRRKQEFKPLTRKQLDSFMKRYKQEQLN